MQITFLGQAGIFAETRHGSVLCDPWFNPAYFASWFPFPSNEQLDHKLFARPDYLYVSHMHHDHFDPMFFADHVSKETKVLLPDYPLDSLEVALRRLGFHDFIRTTNCQPLQVGGLRFMIMALVAPTDGPIGDSALVVDDGEVCILNQNDSRPVNMEALARCGPYDGHFLQYSGAIWYPMVYRFDQKLKDALGRKKRRNQMARAVRYIEEVGASFVFPSAGPPCFLDDELYHLNDFDRDPTNIFCDQTVFLEYLRGQGSEQGRLAIPGSRITLSPNGCEVVHPQADDEVAAIFTRKREYLDAYRSRKQPVIDAARAAWPRGGVDILASLKDWFEPLLEQADLTCAGVNGRVLIDCGPKVVIDFVERRVHQWQGEVCRYKFHIDQALIESCILTHEVDWVNELFLSCRFEAEREGKFNEYVYNFFKGLSAERLQYAEGYYSEQAPVQELWECQGYMVQKRCPHLKADLSRFAEVEDGVLTCTMHGWQFELATGRCLTSDDRRLYTRPVEGGQD